MTRGNQRELAREKASKQGKGKNLPASEQKGNQGLSQEQRKERDAAIMREKQEKKKAAAEAGNSSKK